MDLKEWSKDSTRYERRLAFRGGQLVQPGQPGVRQGYNAKKDYRKLEGPELVERIKREEN